MLNVAEAPKQKKAARPLSIVPVSQPEAERVRGWFNERIERCKHTPVSEVVTVSPALAILLLDRNSGNRRISDVNLDRIKRDIMASRFAFNGEAIVVSKDGRLIDGQHRLR